MKGTILGQMAETAIALSGFNDLLTFGDVFFLLMNHFLYCFLRFSEKGKKSSLSFFFQMDRRISFAQVPRLPVRRFQMPFEGLNFVKTLLTIGIIYATDPLTKYNYNKIVCFC